MFRRLGIFDLWLYRIGYWSDIGMFCLLIKEYEFTVKQGQPSFITYFELDTRPNGTDLLSAMNGVFQTGGVIGTLILPWFCDKWGRKWGIAVVSDEVPLALSLY